MFARAGSFPSPLEMGSVMVGTGLGLGCHCVTSDLLAGCHLGPSAPPHETELPLT